MENKIINLAVVAEVASALKELKKEVVFVGGAVVSVYTDDPAADEIRPTKDVDLTINVLNLSEWEILQERLNQLGFYPDPFGQSICSYKFNDIPVDIMSLENGPFGKSNSWYKIGYNNLSTVKANNEEINVFSAPCYLAIKFETFMNRGSDYRTSHDIEDIVYILDNRVGIVDEIANDDIRIRHFIIQQLQQIISKGLMMEILVAHIHPIMIAERLPIIEEKIGLILSL